MNEMRNGERRRRSPSEWRRLISAQADSGLNQREFCDRESIPLGSFCNAKRRLQISGGDETQSDFVSLSPVYGLSSSGWEVELSVGDVVIRVRGG